MYKQSISKIRLLKVFPLTFRVPFTVHKIYLLPFRGILACRRETSRTILRTDSVVLTKIEKKVCL